MTRCKFREMHTDVLFCEVCRKEFQSRETFERGCFKCSPIVVQKPKPYPERREFDRE